MLRYREAGRRDHKTGGGGDVIRVHAVATCTHDVHLAESASVNESHLFACAEGLCPFACDVAR